MAFTSEQQEQFYQLPAFIIGGVMSAEQPRILKSVLEMRAASNFFSHALEQYPGNPYVRDIVNYMQAQTDPASAENQPKIDLSQASIFGHLDTVFGFLGNDDNTTGFKHFIYDLADQVAKATGTGLFGSGPKVSTGEAEFLQTLKAKLGI